MADFLLDVVKPLFASTAIYPVSAVLCAVDGFLPLVPSEAVVITSGAFAADGAHPVLLVILVAAIGAFAGDGISYLLGRTLGRRYGHRLWRTPKRRRAHDWASRSLERRGGAIIIVARFIPGGRTATTLTAGAVGYPPRQFAGFAAIAAMAWAIYMTGLGYLGSAAFRDDPLKATVLGIGISLVVSVVVEVTRRILSNKRNKARTREYEPEPSR